MQIHILYWVSFRSNPFFHLVNMSPYWQQNVREAVSTRNHLVFHLDCRVKAELINNVHQNDTLIPVLVILSIKSLCCQANSQFHLILAVKFANICLCVDDQIAICSSNLVTISIPFLVKTNSCTYLPPMPRWLSHIPRVATFFGWPGEKIAPLLGENHVLQCRLSVKSDVGL